MRLEFSCNDRKVIVEKFGKRSVVETFLVNDSDDDIFDLFDSQDFESVDNAYFRFRDLVESWLFGEEVEN